MAPRKNRGKKKVMTLTDFNPAAAHATAVPELAALPSAPKMDEEWDAVGGRPEYNSRGFKERTVTTNYEDGLVDDEEFMQRDWTRSGPMDDPDDPAGAGQGGGDRSWDGMRRGPLDDPNAGDGQERSWEGMRRGPVDAETPGDGGVERNWDGMRRGPVDAIGTNEKEVDFRAARRGPVEAEFEGRSADVDFSQRRGPVDAEFGDVRGGDVDFSTRRGPIEAEFEARNDMDFSTRRGPVEAAFESPGTREVDFAVRTGPVEADSTSVGVERDFGAARRSDSMVEASSSVASPPVERDFGSARKGAVSVEAVAQKQSSELDFGSARRGNRSAESSAPGGTTSVKESGHTPGNVVDWNVRKGPLDGAGSRLRDSDQPAGTSTSFGASRLSRTSTTDRESTTPEVSKTNGNFRERSADGTAHPGKSLGNGLGDSNEAPKERDWGRARQGQPVSQRIGDSNGVAGVGNRLSRTSLSDDARTKSSPGEAGNGKSDLAEDSGDWTTVRSTVRRGGTYVARGRAGFRGGFSQRGRGARLVPVAGQAEESAPLPGAK